MLSAQAIFSECALKDKLGLGQQDAVNKRACKVVEGKSLAP